MSSESLFALDPVSYSARQQWINPFRQFMFVIHTHKNVTPATLAPKSSVNSEIMLYRLQQLFLRCTKHLLLSHMLRKPSSH